MSRVSIARYVLHEYDLANQLNVNVTYTSESRYNKDNDNWISHCDGDLSVLQLRKDPQSKGRNKEAADR